MWAWDTKHAWAMVWAWDIEWRRLRCGAQDTVRAWDTERHGSPHEAGAACAGVRMLTPSRCPSANIPISLRLMIHAAGQKVFTISD
jgi:hypothetical protein